MCVTSNWCISIKSFVVQVCLVRASWLYFFSVLFNVVPLRAVRQTSRLHAGNTELISWFQREGGRRLWCHLAKISATSKNKHRGLITFWTYMGSGPLYFLRTTAISVQLNLSGLKQNFILDTIKWVCGILFKLFARMSRCRNIFSN